MTSPSGCIDHAPQSTKDCLHLSPDTPAPDLTSTIGAAIARGMAAAGAKVVINYVANEKAARQMINEIETAGGETMVIHA